MTKDPFEKHMFTDVNMHLINFTLKKKERVFDIKPFTRQRARKTILPYHEFPLIRRDNELQSNIY